MEPHVDSKTQTADSSSSPQLGTRAERVLDRRGLAREKGIQGSRTWYWRMIQRREFPEGFILGNRRVWLESDIDRWLRQQAGHEEQS